ncbi:MAG TPA: hypothetical protein VGQ55_08220, partial [Pyrinomonadaceae bacterium]|nr:hypothetical protein [Pyrinomonadaceae bacterium]
LSLSLSLNFTLLAEDFLLLALLLPLLLALCLSASFLLLTLLLPLLFPLLTEHLRLLLTFLSKNLPLLPLRSLPLWLWLWPLLTLLPFPTAAERLPASPVTSILLWGRSLHLWLRLSATSATAMALALSKNARRYEQSYTK